jgi:hypothetical protein
MAQALFYLGVGDSGVGLFARLLRRLGDAVVKGPEALVATIPAEGATLPDAAEEEAASSGPVVAVRDDAVGGIVAWAFGQAHVHPIDARPEAAELLAPSQGAAAERLAELLVRRKEVAGPSAEVVAVHHPCLAQFAPACRDAARQAGLEPRFVLYTRRPAAAIDPNGWWYGQDHPLGHRLAGWVSTTLAAEAATRHERRAVVCHEQVLRDWMPQMAAVAVTLGVPVLRRAEAVHTAAANQRLVGELADSVPRELERSHVRLASLDVAPDLVGLATRTDEGMRKLAAEPDWPDAAELDALAAEAALAYRRALAWSASSTLPTDTDIVIEDHRATRVPHAVRRLIPASVRRLAH